LEQAYELEDVQITCGTNALPVAAVRLRGPKEKAVWATSFGNGPVDATFKAIDQIVAVPNELLEFTVQAMTEGVDAVGKVAVRIRGEVPLGETDQVEDRVFLGRGADTDILVASAKAYLFALNRLLAARRASQRRQVLTDEVRRAVEEMHARYGSAHTGDFMGWSAMRAEDLI
jgi:2-isopropylmalate synthase